MNAQSQAVAVPSTKNEVAKAVEGEVVLAGSLDDLKLAFQDVSGGIRDTLWEMGRIMSEAKHITDDAEAAKAQGYTEATPQKRYKAWLDEAIRGQGIDYDVNTLKKIRDTYEVFGDRQKEVSALPHSGLYILAAESNKDVREEVIAEVMEGDGEPTVAAITKAVKKAKNGGEEPAEPTGAGATAAPTGVYADALKMLSSDDADWIILRDQGLALAQSLTSATIGAAGFEDGIKGQISDDLCKLGGNLNELATIRTAIDVILLCHGREVERAALAKKQKAEAAAKRKAATAAKKKAATK